MNRESQAKDLLYKKFDHRRVNSVVNHFLECTKGFEKNDWEKSLVKAGKFVEAVVKMIWVYCNETLPRHREFKASVYAQKITNINKKTLPDDEIRLQIPRACIFTYDIISNRGARHDPEELDPNEMDATIAISTCSWILAELVRFSAKEYIDIDKAKEIVDSLIKRKYPTFEEIDGRIYVDSDKYETSLECAILILYALYPRRIEIGELSDSLERHGFEMRGFRWDNLDRYIDIDDSSCVLLRATGRQRAEQILNR